MKVEIQKDGIHFSGYPFPGASIYPSGVLGFEKIRDFDDKCFPPEVRLLSKEVLFVDHPFDEEIFKKLTEVGIPKRTRVDVWDLLLEPYLDTWFDEVHQKKTLAQLLECGIEAKEVKKIRKKVGRRVFLYNSIHWDWVHLGQRDLLAVFTLELNLRRIPLIGKMITDYYQWSMQIAEKGTYTS